MTRPNIIRADTIDLQNQEAPSAKDHTRQPSRPGALGEGPPAPHQADALKHVELELNEQHGRSPRASQDLSGKELGLLHHEDDSYGADNGIGQGANSLMHNAGSIDGTGAEDDLEGDDDEDDMMDKISSSPSLNDDGGYRSRLFLPRQGSSLRSSTPPPEMASSPGTPPDVLSSSPFYETPKYFPLSFPRKEQDYTPTEDHHHQGGYAGIQRTRRSIIADDLETENRDRSGPSIYERRMNFDDSQLDDEEESYEEGLDSNEFRHLLLPADDPLLDNSFDDYSEVASATSSPLSKTSWDETKEPGINDDDTEEISYVDDSRFVDSGWGGECLRETEDIDFEFVYALHTFVATVEGQANATKGDTMVLLDDSNSYWWLVRVVKDSSIGYLPAEHIETPLERLARLNKHRNLDLSQTMLGDEEERKPGHSLNPLKKAIKRRNMKTVQFTAPSYVEPSDVEYSTEEEGEGDDGYLGQEQDSAATQNDEKEREVEQTAVVEPLKPRSQTRDARQNGEVADSSSRNGTYGHSVAAEDVRSSDDTFERADDGTAAKSRKGTVRNTDSFFKDDSVETRKINLTPSLLRDDSKGAMTTSLEPNEQLKTRPSLDSLEKEDPPEKGKKDKKPKEKRGMLGGMFKRKDKKSKVGEKDVEETEKTSTEVSRLSPQPKESLETLTHEVHSAKSTPQPHRQTSKLQKSPPIKLSPKSSYTLREPTSARPNAAEQESAMIPEPNRAPPSVSEQNESLRMVHQPESDLGPGRARPSVSEQNESLRMVQQPESEEGPSRAQPFVSEQNKSLHMVQQPESDLVTEDTAAALNFNPPAQDHQEPSEAESPKDGRRGMFSPIKDALKLSQESKPEKARRAKNRMQMDDFDSTSSEDEPTEQALSEPESQDEPEPHLAIAQEAQHEDKYDTQAPNSLQVGPARERLSESPVEVSSPQDYDHIPPQEQQRTAPLEHQRAPHRPPPLMVDTSSQEDPSTSPVSPLSSPELVEAPDEQRLSEETPASTAQSATPTWSDTSLRDYLEDDSEIRDLLVIVHDKSNIKPARRDHPIVKNMYREENRKLGEISSRLDGLLGDYLARKSKTAAQ